MFKFKGISSEDMRVVIEEEEHFIARASQRYERTEIDGRDGALFNELGYSMVERPIYVQCLDTDKIDDILAWLNGEGEFEYKGRITRARFYSELEPKREAFIRIIDTTFIRNPFWYKSIDEYEAINEEGYNTTEGETIDLTDSVEYKLKSIDVKGNTEQYTTTGKNLLDISYAVLNYSIDANTGLNISWPSYACGDNYISVLPNTAYTFSTNSSMAHMRLSEYDENKNHIQRTSITNDNKITITTTANTYFIRWALNKNDLISMTAELLNSFDLQIEQGIEATTYEEYTGMQPSPSPDYPQIINNVTGDNEIIVQNKNLIPNSSDIDLTTNANITILDLGQDVTFENITLSFYMKDAKYTATGNICNFQKNDGTNNYQPITDFGMTVNTVLNGQYSKTLSNITFRYLILYARTTSYVSWQQGTCNIQLEKGTEATPYIAHAEQTVTFPLGTSKMYNGDYLADDGIHHTKNRQQYQSIVGGYNSSNNWFYWDTSVAMYDPYNKTVLCNYLKYYDITTFSGSNSLIGISINPSGTYVLLRNTSLTTAQEYKDWVASLYQNNTPLELEYELAEEVIEPYNTAQQEAWNNIKAFYTYQGITHISQENDNVPFMLKVVYRKDQDISIENEGNIQSRPILKLTKTIDDYVELTINNVRFKYNFPEDEDYVEINCEEKTVTYNNLNRNKQIEIGFEFPKLEIGENAVLINSGDAIIEVKRKDRWL